MADMIHMSLSNFRNTMLTAVACLECELRDRTMPVNNPVHIFPEDSSRIIGLESSMDLLRRTILEFNHTLVEMGLRIQDVEQKVDLLAVTPSPDTNNPIYTSQEFTSYRYQIHMKDDAETLSSIEDIEETADIDEAAPAGSELIHEVDENIPVEAEPEPEIDEHANVPSSESVHSISEDEENADAEEGSDMEVLTLDGVDYYIDNDQYVFTLDIDAGEYTQVGTYDPEEGTIAFLSGETEEEADQEADQEAEEVEEDPMEEFNYKGTTYYRDSESNVYTLDADAGEYTHIGSWNGKKIIKV